MKPTLDDLLAQRAQLDAAIAEARQAEKGAAIDACKSLIAKHGLTPFDLGFTLPGAMPSIVAKPAPSLAVPKSAPVLPPKYRDPKTGQTWSGRGRQPLWIKGDRADYSIDKPQAEYQPAPVHRRVGHSALEQIKQSAPSQPNTLPEHEYRDDESPQIDPLKNKVEALREKFGKK